MSSFLVLIEVENRNRWRDGQVCPGVGQGIMATWVRRPGWVLVYYAQIGRGRPRETFVTCQKKRDEGRVVVPPVVFKRFFLGEEENYFRSILTSLWPPPAKKSAPCACSEPWVHFRENFTKQKRFVEWAQNEIAVVPDFHKRILFSDEAHFWLNGYVNKQNCRIWSEANPQVCVETPLHPEKLTV
ncbi:uncharacterized protein TNCV_1410971 [Trichonephila clavipes]|nr:uncharacterized protein TNCV_1410971 [Trichonephila clavipes]